MTSLGTALKTSDLFVKALENEGVEYIFAVPGGALSPAFALLQSSRYKTIYAVHAGEENLDLVESLRTSSIKLIVVRHEQAGDVAWLTLRSKNACMHGMLICCPHVRRRLHGSHSRPAHR